MEGKRAYDRKKAYLPAISFAGVFLPSRGNSHLQQHSGLVHADMDNLIEIKTTKRSLCSDPRTAYVFTSPSGTGLKAGIHVPFVTGDADYKHAWHAVRAEYERLYGAQWDTTGKDISRLCFVSHDSTMYSNLEALCFDVPPAPDPQPTPDTFPRLSFRKGNHHCCGYAERAIKTAVQMIQSAPLGTRHHTRLRAARLLGGYVAGGVLTEGESYGALAQALVGYTEDLPRALKTVGDGLRYGQAHPIRLQALEADRQAWAAQRRPTEPLRAPDDPWDGIPTLPLRPYLGYRGITSRRVQPHG
jgi:hypothetical protein